MRICLAGSGGGHVRQLLDLKPLWEGNDCFFITERSALSQSISETYRTYFVPHVALGQAKLGHPVRMIAAALRSLVISARIVMRERPDVIITTGAGSMFFTVLWARLIGVRIILIDSFARFNARSAFARIASPFASVRIAQSEPVARGWRGAVLFDPLRYTPVPDHSKSALLFATVGTTLPFNRLASLVINARRDGQIPEDIILQTGVGGERSEEIQSFEMIPFDDVQAILRKASLVVCHGGTGSLITALREGCRVIAIPRRFALGEHYDDHQLEITKAFADRGLISVAETPEQFRRSLIEARARAPIAATTDHSALIDYLRNYLEA